MTPITTEDDLYARRDAIPVDACRDVGPEESCNYELTELDPETERRAETALRRRLEPRIDAVRRALEQYTWRAMTLVEEGARFSMRATVEPAEDGQDDYIPLDRAVRVEVLDGERVVLDRVVPVECARSPEACVARYPTAWVEADLGVVLLEVIAVDPLGNGTARYVVGRFEAAGSP